MKDEALQVAAPPRPGQRTRRIILAISCLLGIGIFLVADSYWPDGEFVHESVKCDGRIGHLDGQILHYTCDSLSGHLWTLDRYTTLAAEQIVWRKQNPPLWRLIVDPPWTFVNTYFIKRGFLDGIEGLAIAYMAAFYTFLKYAKARFMSRD